MLIIYLKMYFFYFNYENKVKHSINFFKFNIFIVVVKEKLG